MEPRLGWWHHDDVITNALRLSDWDEAEAGWNLGNEAWM